MTQDNFKIESQLNGDKGQLVVVASTNPKNEVPIPNGGKENFSLKPGDELCIQVRQNGNIINLQKGLYIQIWPFEGFNCELSTTKTEIKIVLPEDLEIVQNYSVTVGPGNTG